MMKKEKESEQRDFYQIPRCEVYEMEVESTILNGSKNGEIEDIGNGGNACVYPSGTNNSGLYNT